MKLRAYTIGLLFFVAISVHAQSSYVKSMKWGKDYKIELEMVNDSVHILDVKALHHAEIDPKTNSPVYYPVSLTDEFVDKLKGKKLEEADKLDSVKVNTNEKPKTLWSAIHDNIGGGWTHFLNTMLYALETNTLDITNPLMKRPESDWKPRPMTDSYKRTKNWEYYVPVDYKMAMKEYKLRDRKGELGDINSLPQEFIDVFLNTSEEEYIEMRKNPLRSKKRAQIDLIKLLLGSNYLGQAQISYISSMVLQAATQYSANQLPSVIIIDELNAAVAMSLDEKGYRVEKIVFNDESTWTDAELNQRRDQIYNLIAQINDVNRKLFEERLKRYYN